MEAVVEEAFHCFDLQTGGFIKHREIEKAKHKMLRGITDPQERRRIDKEIEERVGVKQIVNELVQCLEQKGEDLFSLLPKIKAWRETAGLLKLPKT